MADLCTKIKMDVGNRWKTIILSSFLSVWKHQQLPYLLFPGLSNSSGAYITGSPILTVAQMAYGCWCSVSPILWLAALLYCKGKHKVEAANTCK